MALSHRTTPHARTSRRLAGVLLAGLMTSGIAQADGLEATEAQLRLLPGDLPGAGYFRLHNDGEASVTLTGADSDAYGNVMLHQSMSEEGMSSMHAVSELEVAAGDTLEFAPKGYHLMLMKRAQPLAVGDQVEVTLTFADAPSLPVTFDVVGPTDL